MYFFFFSFYLSFLFFSFSYLRVDDVGAVIKVDKRLCVHVLATHLCSKRGISSINGGSSTNRTSRGVLFVFGKEKEKYKNPTSRGMRTVTKTGKKKQNKIAPVVACSRVHRHELEPIDKWDSRIIVSRIIQLRQIRLA